MRAVGGPLENRRRADSTATSVPAPIAMPTSAVARAGLSGLAIFGLGAAITRLTGVHPLRSGLRQLAFGAAAASITYGIGVLVGAAVR